MLAGISTGGVVLATVCEAADKDSRLVVLKDSCADGDLTLDETLVTKIFSKTGGFWMQRSGCKNWLLEMFNVLLNLWRT